MVERMGKRVSHEGPYRALVEVLLQVDRVVGPPDQTVAGVALPKIVPSAVHHRTPAVTTSVLPDLSDWTKFVA